MKTWAKKWSESLETLRSGCIDDIEQLILELQSENDLSFGGRKVLREARHMLFHVYKNDVSKRHLNLVQETAPVVAEVITPNVQITQNFLKNYPFQWSAK